MNAAEILITMPGSITADVALRFVIVGMDAEATSDLWLTWESGQQLGTNCTAWITMETMNLETVFGH